MAGDVSLSILTSSDQSSLLRRLMSSLDAIDGRLDDPDAWHGMAVGGVYIRLETFDHLVASKPDHREYAVGIHLFERPARTELHDHRWPFAVYPFGEHVAKGTPLYDMPWEDGPDSGTVTIRSHQPYAIERSSIRHAVHSVRPHLSIVMTDVTAPPAREPRLPAIPLPRDEITLLLLRIRRALH